jgi:hypothetical protein
VTPLALLLRPKLDEQECTIVKGRKKKKERGGWARGKAGKRGIKKRRGTKKRMEEWGKRNPRTTKQSKKRILNTIRDTKHKVKCQLFYFFKNTHIYVHYGV